MKSFDPFALSLDQCRDDYIAFRQLLDTHDELGEASHVLPFFRAQSHFAALCGWMYNSKIHRCDRLAWEFDLFGDFVCDFAIGDSVRGAFTFLEFEDATANSLFVKQGKKATREWSPRLDRGYGQLIDWFYKLRDRRNGDNFLARFGKRSIEYTGVLVIGRDRFMDASERLRLDFRSEYVVVDSKKIYCVTFDELADSLHDYLIMLGQPLPPRP
jgi:hypothetical protein